MHYEHIIQINDPRDPRVPPVAAELLWQLLLRTATQPQMLRPDLDSAEVLQLEALRWQRRLRFGPLTIIEDLRADTDSQALLQTILAPSEMAGGSRMVRIETPAPGHLVLRFRYDSPHASAGTSQDQQNAFRSAYLQADLAQVQMLRQWIDAQLVNKP